MKPIEAITPVVPTSWNAPNYSNCSSCFDNDSLSIPPYTDIFKEWKKNNLPLYKGTSIFFIILCTIVTCVNIVILLSACFLKKAPSIVLINVSLVASDTLTVFCYGLSFLVFSLLPSFEIYIYKEESCFGLVVEACKTGGIVTTLSHLGLIALYHFRAIAKPLNIMTYPFSTRNVYCFLVVLWTIPNGLACLHMFYPGQCRKIHLSNQDFRLWYAVIFFTALGLMLYLYTRIYIKIKQSEKFPIGEQATRRHYMKQEKDRTYFYITFLNMITLVLCWTPAFLLSILICDLGCPIKPAPMNIFSSSILVYFLLIFKTAINTYLFADRAKEIKGALSRMRKSLCCCCPKSKRLQRLSPKRSLRRGYALSQQSTFTCETSLSSPRDSSRVRRLSTVRRKSHVLGTNV